MPIEDTVREAILPSKSTEPKSCHLCDQLKAERDQIVAELKTATNLVDHSQDLASEMELRSQETGKQISVHKQMIEEFRKRTVKLEETEAALADVKSQLASLQRTVYEEVKHAVDACEEEIRTLRRQLAALTAMTGQEKEFPERRIIPQIHTIEDRAGDKLLSTSAEDVGNDCSLDRERKRAETPVEYESDVVIEDFYGLELQDWESEHEPQDMVDYVHVLKGNAISGNESVAEPRYYALAKDSPLPCDESWDVVDKSTTELLKKETNAAAKILPPAITSFTRDQIISKDCCLTYAIYCDKFWLQLDPCLACNIMMDIMKFSRTDEFKRSTFQGTVGDACLAPYKESELDPGLWHRAVVQQICGDVCTAFCVDFGNSFAVRMSELKSLPAHLALHPPLAYHCTLDGIDSIENDVTDAFDDLFWKSTPVAVQFKRMIAGKLSVRLFRTSDNEDLNEKLGLASS